MPIARWLPPPMGGSSRGKWRPPHLGEPEKNLGGPRGRHCATPEAQYSPESAPEPILAHRQRDACRILRQRQRDSARRQPQLLLQWAEVLWRHALSQQVGRAGIAEAARPGCKWVRKQGAATAEELKLVAPNERREHPPAGGK